MEKIMALYDSDFLYATRFMGYINRQKEFNIKISAFTREKSLRDYINAHPVEILVLGEEISLEDLPCHRIRHIYRLGDDSEGETEAGVAQIFKYQSAKSVMKRIMSDYMDKEGASRTPDNSGQTKLISVFAPLAGAEKLSFAWALSSLLSEQGKVLFVSLDPFPIPFLSAQNSNPDLSEFIYYLKEKSGLDKMKPLLSQIGNLSILSGVHHGSDILSLGREDITRWLEALRQSVDYKRIVLYLGCYTEAITEVMSLSDRILAVSLDSAYETAVLSEWEEQMKRCDGCNPEKIRPVRLQVQTDPGHIPITLQELKESPAWNEAVRFVNL